MGVRKGSKKEGAPKLGYLEGFADAYTVVKELGKGGNGVVRLAVHRQTGMPSCTSSLQGR
jgi:hypothetical protein